MSNPTITGDVQAVINSVPAQTLITDITQIVESRIPAKTRIAMYAILNPLGIAGIAVIGSGAVSGWAEIVIQVVSVGFIAFSEGVAISHVPAKTVAAPVALVTPANAPIM